MNFSKGYALDDGDLPWYINFFPRDSKYNCMSIPGYFIVAIPKEKIKVGDYWYFSGVKFLYAGKTQDNKMLIISQKSEAILKKYPEACPSCLDVITIKKQSAIASILSIYPEDIQKKVSQWKYSEGEFYFNKIPKEFPSEQVYSVDEVEKRSKAGWVPD